MSFEPSAYSDAQDLAYGDVDPAVAAALIDVGGKVATSAIDKVGSGGKKKKKKKKHAPAPAPAPEASPPSSSYLVPLLALGGVLLVGGAAVALARPKPPPEARAHV